jgi:1,4-dihydroxy-2-naphthoyl-CoA hydrolase
MSDRKEEQISRRFPGLLGIRIAERRHGYCRAEMDVDERHLRPYIDGLHAGAVVSIADSACGMGCQASLPEGRSFTTVELKANLIGSAASGIIVAEATPVHMGRTTHVWEARVTRADGKLIAVFTCTQLIIEGVLG